MVNFFHKFHWEQGYIADTSISFTSVVIFSNIIIILPVNM